jgi:hypothetical protein
MNAAASKWEVLVHVANVLELYFKSKEDNNAIALGRSDSYVQVLHEVA